MREEFEVRIKRIKDDLGSLENLLEAENLVDANELISDIIRNICMLSIFIGDV